MHALEYLAAYIMMHLQKEINDVFRGQGVQCRC